MGTEANHSPAPMRRRSAEVGERYSILDANGIVIARVASVWDADLFAAAPDLLAALDGAEREIEVRVRMALLEEQYTGISIANGIGPVTREWEALRSEWIELQAQRINALAKAKGGRDA